MWGSWALQILSTCKHMQWLLMCLCEIHDLDYLGKCKLFVKWHWLNFWLESECVCVIMWYSAGHKLTCLSYHCKALRLIVTYCNETVGAELWFTKKEMHRNHKRCCSTYCAGGQNMYCPVHPPPFLYVYNFKIQMPYGSYSLHQKIWFWDL